MYAGSVSNHNQCSALGIKCVLNTGQITDVIFTLWNTGLQYCEGNNIIRGNFPLKDLWKTALVLLP